jgi:pimeloyl-ACP methyl ester carboxylesterase
MTTWRLGRLSVHEYGEPSAPALVVLHGVTDSGECWGDLVGRIGSTYRILAPDALGHGSSERFAPEDLGAHPGEAMYDAAVTLLREVGPALVLGHSMGGATAGALAAREPGLVRGVVLEDPAWFDEVPWGDPDQVTRDRVKDARAVAADLAGAVVRCRAEHPAWPASELGPWAQAKADVDLEFLRSGRFGLATPWREVAAAISVPTLVVTGDGEVILGSSMLSEIGRLNPDLETTVVAGADHCVRRDRGDSFHAVVDPWVAHASQDSPDIR